MSVTTQAQLEEWIIESVEGQMVAIGDRLVAEVDARGLLTAESEGRLLTQLRNAATAELRAGIRAFNLGRRLPVSPPAETGELARQAARARVPLAVLVRVYMVALGVYWEAILDAILASGAPASIQTEVMRIGTHFLHEFVAQISGLAADEYTDEHDRAVHRRTLRRLATVRDVLAGTASTGAALDYNLGLTHCGVVATGAGAEDMLAAVRAAPRVAVLVVPDDETVWAWIGGAVAAIAQAQGALEAVAKENVRVGIGRPQPGLEGFRVTHRQALAAHVLAESLGRPVVRHREFALETLAGGLGPTAAQFIHDELGPLVGSPIRNQRLLHTLSAYLEAGQSGAAAAARLGISARTVSHRLHLIEDALGHSVADRAVELNTALRLRAVADEAQDRAKRQA
jgi:PucR C-terminal helix-turn-helix domain/GGDEF-like domain